MRHLLVLLVGALAFASCIGGDKESRDGQADYLDQVLEIINDSNAVTRSAACSGDDDLLASCDREALVNALEASVERMQALEPPPAVRPHHAAVVETYYDALGILAVPTEELVDRASDFRELILAEERFEEWYDAVFEVYGVRLFKFEGLSMAPAFCDGDTVAVRPPEREIARWDVIVFEFPQDRDRDFVKRVVGLPGETIAVHDGNILVDGQPVDNDVYALAPPNYEVEPLVIPPERYYVLGDNRRNSFDSHQWSSTSAGAPEMAATVPYDHIIGVLPADLVMCEMPP
jgi:signal peptidase I